jgi:hypothetical protein
VANPKFNATPRHYQSLLRQMLGFACAQGCVLPWDLAVRDSEGIIAKARAEIRDGAVRLEVAPCEAAESRWPITVGLIDVLGRKLSMSVVGQ